MDKSEIKGLDDIVIAIDNGLANSEFAVIFASTDYFRREWTRLEYQSILYRATSSTSMRYLVVRVDKNVDLPPLLAGRKHLLPGSAEDVASSILSEISAVKMQPSSTHSKLFGLQAEAIDWHDLNTPEIIALTSEIIERIPAMKDSTKATQALFLETFDNAGYAMAISTILLKSPILPVQLHALKNTIEDAIQLTVVLEEAASKDSDPARAFRYKQQATEYANRSTEAINEIKKILGEFAKDFKKLTPVEA